MVIKVPDLGLSEPRISNLFGTLAQVCPTPPKSTLKCSKKHSGNRTFRRAVLVEHFQHDHLFIGVVLIPGTNTGFFFTGGPSTAYVDRANLSAVTVNVYL